MLKVRAGRVLPEVGGHKQRGDTLAVRTRKATRALGMALSCPSAPVWRAVVALASRSRRRRNMDVKCLFV